MLSEYARNIFLPMSVIALLACISNAGCSQQPKSVEATAAAASGKQASPSHDPTTIVKDGSVDAEPVSTFRFQELGK